MKLWKPIFEWNLMGVLNKNTQFLLLEKPVMFGVECIVLFGLIIISEGTPCNISDILGADDPSQIGDEVDQNSGQLFMLRDQQSIVQCCGYISEWKFNIKNPGTITFQVWRETGPGRYTLRGEYATHYNTGEEDNEVVVRTTIDKHLAVDVGDHIGWYNEKEAMVAFEIDSTGQGILINSVNTPVDVKNEMDWSQVLATESRTYAIQAIVSKGVAPKFKNLDADVEIFEHLTVGSDIYRLQLVDFVDDRVPITFRITMNDNMNHFEFNRSTLTAYLAKTPPVGKYNLVFTVSDHCGYSDTALLNVVVKKPKPAIINLPASVSVREDIGSVEVPLLNISVADSVPVICDVKSVEPTEESAFFSVKSNRFQASLYLKATHSLDYEKVQQYVLTIHCFNGHDSDSGLVNILVEPNQVPTIQNLPATVSVSSIRVNFGDSVYRITVEDAERNTVSLNSTCEPLPCPFTVTNAGFVIVVGNLFSAMSDMYIIHIVASDSYNTAPPKQLVVSVSDRNTPPYIYNIPDNLKIDLAENLPVGTLVLHVLASDVNPLDNLLFALQIQPSEFFPFFTINETSGEIYIRSFINYESLQESDVTLYPSVSDGHNTFSTDFKVSINDINEPPRFEHTSYWIKTNESNEGRVISKGIIKASDEDKDDQVTYSLECDLDEVNSIFQMNVETADITQTYNIDVDHLLTTERNITCRVIASDKLKATATAPLRIVVADINDNGPLFVKSSHVFVVTQNTPILSSVGYAIAVDHDISIENKRLSYYFSENIDSFLIDNAGVVRTLINLSIVPVGSTFRNTLNVRDKANNLSDSSPFTIVVMPGNYTILESYIPSEELTFFNMPENIAWFVTALHLAAAALGLLTYLCFRYCTLQLRDQFELNGHKHRRNDLNTPMARTDRSVWSTSCQSSRAAGQRKTVANDSPCRLSTHIYTTSGNLTPWKPWAISDFKKTFHRHQVINRKPEIKEHVDVDKLHVRRASMAF